jgi:hypothetical protein
MADSAIWVKVFPTTGPGSIGEWAKVTGGTVTEYTKGDGSVMEVHTFTADGTLTVESPGYAEVLLVGGGGYGQTGIDEGAGGRILDGIRQLAAGAHAVVIGTGSGSPNYGSSSKLGTLDTGSVKWGNFTTNGNPNGRYSSITGTNLLYGPDANVTRPGGGGNVANGTVGAAGIVIVAVQKSAPTVSGIVASGGTESTYVGDGVNGTLGQSYKVHTFTASGNLVVTQGGEAEVLILGGGGGFSTVSGGGGGDVIRGRQTLAPGTVPVVVGAGAPGGTSVASWAGQASSFGSLVTAISGMETGAGGTIASRHLGISSTISGSSVTYGTSGKPAVSCVPNRGEGSSDGAGSSGVVIVRYKV